jgi:hypothetical protein
VQKIDYFKFKNLEIYKYPKERSMLPFVNVACPVLGEDYLS